MSSFSSRVCFMNSLNLAEAKKKEGEENEKPTKNNEQKSQEKCLQVNTHSIDQNSRFRAVFNIK